MKKKEYIHPDIKIHVKVAHALLNSNTWEQGNDPGDSEGKGVNFLDDEPNVWGNTWN
jgi:hypothetical protein